MRSDTRRRRGFTLMEVLLVLVILVILGSLAVGVFTNVQRKALLDSARSQVGLFKTPLELYFQAMNDYPATTDGLQALVSPPGNQVAASKWAGPYLEALPVDPWNNPYQYSYPGKHNPDKYDVWSLGPDGSDNTADDIGNWQP
jgi:general secretion pathway protein G